MLPSIYYLALQCVLTFAIASSSNNCRLIVDCGSELTWQIFPQESLERLTEPRMHFVSQALTWTSGKSFCEDRSEKLCSSEKLCDDSSGQFHFNVLPGDHWVPVDDSDNEWVEIGDSLGRTCYRHGDYYGPPPWGISPASKPHKGYVYCCPNEINETASVSNFTLNPVFPQTGGDSNYDETSSKHSVAQNMLQLIKDSVKKFRQLSSEPRIFYSTRQGVFSINSTSFEQRSIVTDVNGTVVSDVDYDPVEGYIYYTTSDAIEKVKKDGSGKQRIMSGSEIDKIAVDWVARNLYWTDSQDNCICVSKLDGSYRKVVIGEGLDRPRGIVVDPAAGKLYWTEWDSNPRVGKASLDGTNIETLVSDGMGWPNDLALDYERRLVYIVDAKTDRIEVIGMDGTGRRTLLDRNVRHPFSLSYLDDFIYWTDWMSSTVERMRVDGDQRRTVLLQAAENNLMGVKATYLLPYSATNPCGKDNGGCLYLCLYNGLNVTCAQPDPDE